MNILILRLIAFGGLLLLTFEASPSEAQDHDQASNKYQSHLAKMASLVQANYVVPDIAEEMASALLALSKTPSLSRLSPDQLGDKLTGELRRISSDPHMTVVPWFDLQSQYDTAKEDSSPMDRFISAKTNQGLSEVSILEGNIGYMKLNGFFPLEGSRQFLESAMLLLSNTSGLVIDLTENDGGSPETVAFLSSYFFGEATLLNRFYNRRSKQWKETWTQGLDQGNLYLNKPIAILTSEQTASAAESFAYIMKHNNKAVIVGSNTSGGAHTSDIFEVGCREFLIQISVSRVVNPITSSNWQNTGVLPDIQISESEHPVNKAQEYLIERLLESTHDKEVRAHLAIILSHN